MEDITRYFEILEIKPGVSIDKVKEAYRDLVKVWHPDRFSHDQKLQQKAQDKLKEINEAYEIIQDFINNPHKYKHLSKNDFGQSSHAKESYYSDHSKQNYYSKQKSESKDNVQQNTKQNDKYKTKRGFHFIGYIIGGFIVIIISVMLFSPATKTTSNQKLNIDTLSVKNNPIYFDKQKTVVSSNELSQEKSYSFNSKKEAKMHKPNIQRPHSDLSSLTREEKSSIEIACYPAKLNGPALYNKCLEEQLGMMRSY